jgi:hypothetical protein
MKKGITIGVLKGEINEFLKFGFLVYSNVYFKYQMSF